MHKNSVFTKEDKTVSAVQQLSSCKERPKYNQFNLNKIPTHDLNSQTTGSWSTVSFIYQYQWSNEYLTYVAACLQYFFFIPFIS